MLPKADEINLDDPVEVAGAELVIAEYEQTRAAFCARMKVLNRR